jgi:enoyl-CoA hydratase/carnithine racemase
LRLDEISYETADGVASIVLNRPEILNAISAREGGTRDQILWALSEADADDAIGCVIIRGAGRAFCGGGDLTGNTPRDSPAEELDFVERSDQFLAQLRRIHIPVVAAVHGYCLGAGVGLAAASDMVIASEGARFGIPEGRIGLIGTTHLTPVIGRQWAKFLVLTGELIDARTAREIGLVMRVVPEELLYSRCEDLARRIARMPREAVALNKRSVNAVADAIEAPGIIAGRAHDALTLSNSGRAQAPDGRRFRDILGAEGMPGLKQARDAQWTDPWFEDHENS